MLEYLKDNPASPKWFPVEIASVQNVQMFNIQCSNVQNVQMFKMFNCLKVLILVHPGGSQWKLFPATELPVAMRFGNPLKILMRSKIEMRPENYSLWDLDFHSMLKCVLCHQPIEEEIKVQKWDDDDHEVDNDHDDRKGIDNDDWWLMTEYDD